MSANRRVRDSRLLMQLLVLALLAVSGGAAASRWLDAHPAVTTSCHGQCQGTAQIIAPLQAQPSNLNVHAEPLASLAPLDWISPRPAGARLSLARRQPRFSPNARPDVSSRAPPAD